MFLAKPRWEGPRQAAVPPWIRAEVDWRRQPTEARGTLGGDGDGIHSTMGITIVYSQRVINGNLNPPLIHRYKMV